MKKNKDESLIIDNKEISINKSSNKKLLYILFSSIFVLYLLIGYVIYAINVNDIDLLDLNNNNVELKYTNTTTTSSKNSGIYITDVSGVVEEVMPSIVAITSKTLISSGQYGPSIFGFGANRYTEGAGSGIIIAKNNEELLILTNNHVVEGSSELTVQFINEKSYDAKIIGTSERKDVAIISVKLSDLDSDTIDSIKIATIGDSDELKVGNGIIAIGNALGYGQSVTTGVISALNREVTIDNYKNEMIQIDAAINGGNSGGALLNSNGEVVGINSAKYSSSYSSSASVEGMGFAIPITDIKDLINDLMNGKEDESDITLGIEGYMTNSSSFMGYNMPTGFYISKIESNSIADKNNLEIGNIITKIEGEDVESVNDITDVLYEKKKGDEISLTISYTSGREYKEKTIKIDLS